MAARTTGCLSEALAALRISATKPATVSKIFARSMATESPASSITKSASTPQTIIQSWNPIATVPVTIHSFPELEPTALEQWSVNHLYLPLRRDLLHSAVVFEGDNTRQGTASSKTRYDVHGSHRKIRPQKGSGRARLGTRQSPSIKGGGKVFGPHPRDFGTRLNRKVYDKAWRTALSYRYRRGELLVCEDGMELAVPEDFARVAHHFKDGLREAYLEKYMRGVLGALGLGRADGRTLFVTGGRRDWLHAAMEQLPTEGRALDLPDVDVKDLLETGRIVLERSVLKEMIEQHQSDLVTRIAVGGLPSTGSQAGEKVL
ncbi:60S ribosomal protein L4 [Cordyceps fumosorosea ARSEF 2679]|uniref:Large ribosomal subunit protein uL4m n=1 Tax=Cordyceps fumosorosea (strain ARSEF 2679) TaxID=1081104 RepID=A0A167Q0F4_CORFA|nr:60S ribosomal protein L4 [Cordyceps fumosorosea ARSEF 2679]OAA57179.1 60S ribosomal protein L4 [Cordyceps fumosorosea ARSEF 2679]